MHPQQEEVIKRKGTPTKYFRSQIETSFSVWLLQTLNSSGKHPPYQSSMTAFPPGLEAELI